MLDMRLYAPDEVAQMLGVSKSTVYELINRGEIVAKKIGRVYRISPKSLSFLFSGLDADIWEAQQKDAKNLEKIEQVLKRVRKEKWGKLGSF